MKTYFIFLVLFVFAKGQLRPNLIPYPNQISFENNSLFLHPCSIDFQFISSKTPNYYYDILSFYYQSTFPKSNCSFERKTNSYKPKTVDTHALKIKINHFEVDKPSYPSKKTDESYKLDLNEQKWVLQAENYHGFLRGIETFFQLLEPIEDNSHYILKFYPIDIEDSPSFPYRGIMIDTARHFIKLNMLKHVIDGMMFHKLNVFHWHIVDEESFPLQLKTFPQITTFGAYSPKEIYTIEDVAEIIEYARYRGVRVIPEIDSPAHSLSWGFSEELKDIALKCPIWADYNGQLDPSLDKTYEIVEGILNDVVDYFPDEYVHLGGDEVSFLCWESKPWIQKFMKENNLTNGIQLQNYYKNRERKLLNSNKSAIFWVNDANFDYQETDIFQFWSSSDKYNLIENYTNSVIFSPYDYFYIDVGYGSTTGNDAWSPFVTWKKIYSFNPYPKEIERDRILGGEVTLWAELNSDSTTDNHLWSRSSAFAERMWNALINNGDADIVGRLVGNAKRLERRGFQVSPVTSEYCEKNLKICFP